MPPIKYIDARASSRTVPAGGTIDVHFEVYRTRICPSLKSSRILTDKDGVERAVSNYTLDTDTKPGLEQYDRTITIPVETPPGPATYQFRIVFACNFIHNLGWPIYVESPKIHFEITPTAGYGVLLTPLPLASN